MESNLRFIYLFLLFPVALFANGQSEGEVESKKADVFWLYETATPEHEEILRNNFVDVVNQRSEDYSLSMRFDPNYDQTLRTSMLADSGPDIIQTAGPSYVQEFAKQSYLLPLDEYAEKYGWLDKYFPMMIDLGSYDGTLYALPKTYESMVLYYNKTLFEEKGWTVPERWEEYTSLCERIKREGLIPIVSGNTNWRPTNEHYVTIFLNHIAGPDNVRKALMGELAWTDPVFVKAIDTLKYYFQEYFTPDYLSFSEYDALAILASGEAAMYPSGTWQFQNMSKYFDETGNEWDWAPIPTAENVPYPVYDLGVGATISINAKTENPDYAAEIINTFSADKDVLVNLNAEWPGEWNLPINTISSEDFGDRIDSRYARSIETIASAVNDGGYGYTTWTFMPTKTNQYLWEAIEKVWLDQISVEEYLSEIDRIFQEELTAGQVPPLPES